MQVETSSKALNSYKVANDEEIAAKPIRRKRSQKAVFITWLRKIHLYVGLWGAVIGLLFGISGILLNHRAIMKIPVGKSVQKTVHVALPDKQFKHPDELSAWMQQELQFVPAAPPLIKKEPAKDVVWGVNEIRQPEKWSIGLHRPQGAINVEYFVGNRFAKLDQVDATPIGTLTRLHMAVGVNAFWILLADTIAGAFILLSITGLLLWTQLHTVRTAAVLTTVGALCWAIIFMWSI